MRPVQSVQAVQPEAQNGEGGGEGMKEILWCAGSIFLPLMLVWYYRSDVKWYKEWNEFTSMKDAMEWKTKKLKKHQHCNKRERRWRDA